jgi:rubrerythrin
MATQSFNHWVCVGCGFIYEGAAPPDECPVCKAPKRAFYPRQFMPDAPPIKPAKEHTEKPAPQKGKQHWVCLGCGYIYEGDSVPDKCPVCKAPKDAFKPRKTFK